MKNKKAHKVYSPKLKKHFPGILNQWTELNQEYCRDFEGDALYWFNERASISTLAGAVWLSDGYALEEFASEKQKRGKTKLGRADLWFACGQTQYWVECKQRWLSIGKRARSTIQIINKGLDLAVKEVKELKGRINGEKTEFLGVVFVAPCLTQSEAFDSEKKSLAIDGFVDKLNAIECDFFSYVFVDELPESYQNGKIYPGCAVIGRLL